MASHGIEIAEGDPAKLFRIVTKLGEGSYGSVYSAVDLRDNTEVAIKVLEVDQADMSELRKEVSILKSCSNPRVVGYRGCWEKGRFVWIVMEYCAGGSLGDLLLLCNIVLDEAQCKAVMYMTLQGLVYLHHRKLIHRDIKAANILLTREGVCKLGDFGVSAEYVFFSKFHFSFHSFALPFFFMFSHLFALILFVSTFICFLTLISSNSPHLSTLIQTHIYHG
jgi:serine/threonine protein kinase